MYRTRHPADLEDFVDREQELERWREEVTPLVRDEVPSAIAYVAKPASGLTRFLEECYGSSSNEALTFFVQGSNQEKNHIFSRVLLTLDREYPAVHEEWRSYIEARGARPEGTNLAASLATILPRVGSVLQEMIEHKVEEHTVRVSEAPSWVAEVFANFLRQVSQNRRIVFFVDNAQDIDRYSMNLLRTTGTDAYSRISYVLGYVHRENAQLDREDLRDRLRGMGYSVRIFEFPRPDSRFLTALAEDQGIDLGPRKAARLVSQRDGHIWGLIGKLRDLQENGESELGEADYALRAYEQQVIRYLLAAEQPLRASDLVQLCSDSQTVHVEASDEIYEAITSLESEGLVSTDRLPGDDITVDLVSDSDPRVTELKEDSAGLLTISEELYQYFARIYDEGSPHSGPEVVPLLYRLSKRVAPQARSEYENEIIRTSLQFGSPQAARDFVGSVLPEQASGAPQSKALRVALFIATREYRQALKILEENDLRNVEPGYITEAFRAICLNREREHRESERIIDRLVSSKTPSPELKVLLASYKLGGRLHENEVDAAQDVFNGLKDELRDARNYGYLLRNAASAFNSPENLDLASRAINAFSRQEDEFGEASSRVNRAGFLCETGAPDDALEDLLAARPILDRFGVNHLHIIENNLGMCQMYLGNYSRAADHLEKAQLYSRSWIPRVFASMNLAMVHGLEGEEESCRLLLQKVEEEAISARIDRACQKFFLGAAALELFTNGDNDQVVEWLDLAEEYPDRMNPEASLGAVREIREIEARGRTVGREELKDFVPTYRLSYWYQNPLALLSEDLLASDTVR